MNVNELLRNLGKVTEDLRTKVKNNLGGHINHTFFWEIMCANSNFQLRPSGCKPISNGELMKSIENTFGSFEVFQNKFSEVGLARFGSGWVWLVVDNGKLDVASTANQDNPMLEGKTPILALDVWEHAYYLKYKNVRADCIRAVECC
jgi:Fe-Mn family superoxide dismutase